MLGQILVEDTDLADDDASHIRQQRVRDAVLGGEFAQALLRVIADREERISRTLERSGDPLQRDQLRLAIGSPPGAAVKDDDRSPDPTHGVQVHRGAVLVGETDIGKGIADARAGLAVVTHDRHPRTVTGGAGRSASL